MTMLKLRDLVPKNVVKSAHIYRQILATFAASLLSLSAGLSFGFTAVLLPQLKNDENFPYDSSYDSWIASISPMAMMMGCFFSGSMSDGIGRKKGQLIIVGPFILGWVILGFANNNAVMLTGRFIIGIMTGAIRPNSMVYIGELTDPNYRAMALLCPSVSIHTGVLISHTVGKYVHWKTCCFLFTLPNLITTVILLFLKESPLWLLHKGKIDEGVKSFRLFRGNGELAEKELKTVLEKYKQKTHESTLKELTHILFSKPFMMGLLTTFLLFVAAQWNGINTLSFYAQDIFENTFSDDIDVFSIVLATDCIRIVAGFLICLFAKVTPQKKTFIACCLVTCVVLVGIVIYMYLSPVGLVWLLVIFMVIYISTASIATNISWSFVAEIFPAKVRGIGSGLTSGISFALLFISVKVTPEIMTKLGTPVMYAIFAIITLISNIFLIFLLPNTDGKSLQEIEDELYKDADVKSNINMSPGPSKLQA